MGELANKKAAVNSIGASQNKAMLIGFDVLFVHKEISNGMHELTPTVSLDLPRRILSGDSVVLCGEF